MINQKGSSDPVKDDKGQTLKVVKRASKKSNGAQTVRMTDAERKKIHHEEINNLLNVEKQYKRAGKHVQMMS